MLQEVEELWAIPGIRAGLIVLGSIVAAQIVKMVLARTLALMAKRTVTEIDDEVVAAVRRPIFLSVIFYGLSWATVTLTPAPKILFTTNALLKTLAVLIWSAALFKVGHILLEALSRRAHKGSVIQPRTVPVFDMLVKVAIFGAAVYFMFLAWRIDVTAWLASAGIVGIAVGFAAKDTLANLFAGIFIVADAPYRVGDWIVLDGGLRGRVTNIGMRSTRILTMDDVEITVPNAVIGNSKIVNEAGGPHVKQRVGIPVAAAYGADIDKVREVMLSCAEGVDHVSPRPAPEVRFREFGDSGLLFELLIWLEQPSKRGLVIDVLNTKIYKAFAAADLEIPFSKHDVYIKEMSGR